MRKSIVSHLPTMYVLRQPSGITKEMSRGIEKPAGATDFGRWLDPTSVGLVY